MPCNSEYRHAVTNFMLLKKMPRCSSKCVSNSLVRGGRKVVRTLLASWPASGYLPYIAACKLVNTYTPIFLVLIAADSN